MKEIIRYCVGIGFIILILYSYDARPSGFLPDPIWTTDPAGDIDPELFYSVGCPMVSPIGLMPLISKMGWRLYTVAIISDDGFEYHYDMIDVIETCQLLDSIKNDADTD